MFCSVAWLVWWPSVLVEERKDSRFSFMVFIPPPILLKRMMLAMLLLMLVYVDDACDADVGDAQEVDVDADEDTWPGSLA